MKVGDLVMMDFEMDPDEFIEDPWGVGIIVEVTDRTPDDVCVFWPSLEAESWEMKALLEVIDGDG
mgnify:CR=1 FL=1